MTFTPTFGGGVTDHGALSGLSDNDHPQYPLYTEWQTWTPTTSGWESGATLIARYAKVGKICFVQLYIEGTSYNTVAQATLPFLGKGGPSGTQYIPVTNVINNGVSIMTGGRCFAQVRKNDVPSSNQVWFWLDGSNNGWTASGIKHVQTSFFYEVE